VAAAFVAGGMRERMRDSRDAAYFEGGLKLGFNAPTTEDAALDEYISDPAKPGPFRSRPIQAVGYGEGLTWSRWLVDQREASGRPDVLAFTSNVLKEPVKISGQPIANLIAAHSADEASFIELPFVEKR
jgi:predicted acyl esterase